MTMPQKINFRDKLEYVTDGANEHAELSQLTLNYPTSTAQDNNVGWTAGGSQASRDRNASNPAHLAGVHYAATGVLAEYRIDLPAAGTYAIRFAGGDALSAARVHAQIYDDTTWLATIGPATTGGANHFIDASGVNRATPAAWDSDNVAIELTFSTTTLLIQFPVDAGENRVITHFSVNSVSGFLPAWSVNSNRIIS